MRSRQRGDSMQNPALDRSRSLSDTQGGAARLRRLALPWADLLHAFSVRNLQKRNFKKRKRATPSLTLRVTKKPNRNNFSTCIFWAKPPATINRQYKTYRPHSELAKSSWALRHFLGVGMRLGRPCISVCGIDICRNFSTVSRKTGKKSTSRFRAESVHKALSMCLLVNCG